ncbi:MAG TPA: cytochrome c biogenesis protein CcsA [Chthoniobacteraceae bacterium]|nr:cytochrome c biogenesis protein CcsA [Chthoniobacteraceae bacterium]
MTTSSLLRRYFSIVLLALFALPGALAQAEENPFAPLESLPVQEGGRRKPFYTFAVETMQSVTGRATYRDGDTSYSAMEMVFELWTRPEAWRERPFILVNYKPLRREVGLDEGRKLFSIKELLDSAAFQAKAAEVAQKQADPAKPKLTNAETEVRDINQRLAIAHGLLSGAAFRLVPDPADKGGSRWLTPAQAATAYPGGVGEAIAGSTQKLLQAFAAKDWTAFAAQGEALSGALGQLEAVVPGYTHASSVMELETFYQKFHPFRWAWIAYALAAITLWLTTLAARGTGYRLAWGFVAIGAALQLFGFVARVIIAGRAPVTNMYESVIWVAFGVIFFAMILEAIYRARIIFLGATPVAVVALILADTQPTVLRPQLDPIAAVLRDNFWLSTHVTSITLSYAAFALALGVGHIILFKVLGGRKISPALYNYLYRSLQIGVLLLAIGTLLGAVWANYSWGRFWDWDPKETWALIALLGYLALLHGRIAGWWKGFGLAIGSVVAFQSVIMAWYGVNFVLGEGLHSYGFGTGGVGYVATYVAAELLFVAVVLVRQKLQSSKAENRGKKASAPSLDEADGASAR